MEQQQWTAAWQLVHVAVLSSIRRLALACCQALLPVRRVITLTVCCVFITKCLSRSTSIDTTMTRQLCFRLTLTTGFSLYINVSSDILNGTISSLSLWCNNQEQSQRELWMEDSIEARLTLTEQCKYLQLQEMSTLVE